MRMSLGQRSTLSLRSVSSLVVITVTCVSCRRVAHINNVLLADMARNVPDPNLDKEQTDPAFDMWDTSQPYGVARVQTLSQPWVSDIARIRALLLQHHAAVVTQSTSAVPAAIVVARVAFTLGYVFDVSVEEETQLGRLIAAVQNAENEGWPKIAKEETMFNLALIAAYRGHNDRPVNLLISFSKALGKDSDIRLRQLQALYEQQWKLEYGITDYQKSLRAAQQKVEKCMKSSDVHDNAAGRGATVHQVWKWHNRTCGVTLSNCISAADRAQLEALDACVHKEAPIAIHLRKFGIGYSNGQEVTLLQQFMPKLLPGVFARIVDAAKQAAYAAGWFPALTIPEKLGIRCIEILDYTIQGGLGWHQDFNSIFTMSVMLSEPDKDFGGGSLEMFIPPGNYSRGHDGSVNDILPVNVGSELMGFLFPSMEWHRVNAITSGHRRVLVIEFWQYDNAFFIERTEPAKQLLALGISGRLTKDRLPWVLPYVTTEHNNSTVLHVPPDVANAPPSHVASSIGPQDVESEKDL